MAENMKKLSLIVNAVLIIAVAILFILVLSGRSNNSDAENTGSEDSSADKGIVYINADSLIIKYEFAQTLSEQLIGKEEASRTELNEKGKVLQQEMMEFQRKVQNNGFLSLDRAQSEERRLREKEGELQELNNRLSNDLMVHQGKVNQQLRDTITTFLAEYCKTKPYQLVLSNTMGDNVLHAVPSLDITNDVVELLNKRYQISLKK
jgi:outer membrane protein